MVHAYKRVPRKTRTLDHWFTTTECELYPVQPVDYGIHCNQFGHFVTFYTDKWPDQGRFGAPVRRRIALRCCYTREFIVQLVSKFWHNKLPSVTHFHFHCRSYCESKLFWMANKLKIYFSAGKKGWCPQRFKINISSMLQMNCHSVVLQLMLPLSVFRRSPSSFHNAKPESTDDVTNEVLEKALTYKKIVRNI